MGKALHINHRTQAGRVIKKFKNARRLAALLGCDPSKVYRWNHPRKKGGTDGLIPSCAMPDVLRVARLEGIILTPEDLHPTTWSDEEVDLQPDDQVGAPA
jgi:hypothetical protein